MTVPIEERASDDTDSEPRPSSAALPDPADAFRGGGFRAWYWLLVPALAVLAYGSVLGVGLLSDDYPQLYTGRQTGIDLGTFLPGTQIGFYRPVGVLLIWQLGWQLWGYNPFGYHLVQLLAHAGSSLLLGLWLAMITGRRALGLLAGALFAVIPLHLEAVAFVGAQFDSFAVLFGLASLLCFTLWWRSGARGWALYLLSLLLYGLAVFTKESMFTFALVLGAAAWFVAPHRGRRTWLKLGYSLLPFFALVALDLELRWTAWGVLGGYGSMRTDYGEFIWNNSAAFVRFLLAPLNPAVFGNVWVQVVGVLSTLALLLGLTVYGRSQARLLLLAGVWVVLALVPVLNLPPKIDDLESNRYLYLVSAGYLVGVSALIYAAIGSARRWRLPMIGAVGVVVLLSIITCWVQLRPWQTATAQVNDIVQGMLRLVPPHARPDGMVWFAQDIPFRYKGVPTFRSGLGISRIFANGGVDYPKIEQVPDATLAPIGGEKRDAFAIHFAFDESRERYYLDYFAGLTAGGPPPSPSESGDNLLLWDFRGCSPDVVEKWQVSGAENSCEPGKGLSLKQPGDDAYIVGPEIAIGPASSGHRYVRLRASVSYPADSQARPLISQWFWSDRPNSWSEDRSRNLPVKQDGQPHIYWLALPNNQVGQAIRDLRFDPINAAVPSEVQWLAVDLVR